MLDVSNDEKMLPTTYGRLQPPLGIYRLKVGAGFILLMWNPRVYRDVYMYLDRVPAFFMHWLPLLILWVVGQIVEFIAVLLRANSEGARHELVKSGAIQLVLKLFFEYVHHSFGLCEYLVLQVLLDFTAFHIRQQLLLNCINDNHSRSWFLCGTVTPSITCCTIMWRVLLLRVWRAMTRN